VREKLLVEKPCLKALALPGWPSRFLVSGLFHLNRRF
jgi:hypothetical protein